MSNFGLSRAIMFILLKQWFVTIATILNCDQSHSLEMNSIYGNEFVIRNLVTCTRSNTGADRPYVHSTINSNRGEFLEPTGLTYKALKGRKHNMRVHKTV